MARRKATAEEKQDVFDPYAALDNQLDSAEKKFNLTAMAVDKHEPRFSTGLMSLDVVLSGGLLGGGWYTCYGGEQSCKSTLAMTILSSIMIQKQFKGRSAYFDYEGSSQGDYIENIMRYMGLSEKVENVFGLRDEETGEWIIQPRVRYYQPDTGEEFFNYLAFLEKSLPDKVRIGKKDWFYIYPNTRENQRMLKGKYDTNYFKTHNKFKVPAEDGSIQSIILCDSYPAMLPKQSDDKEEGDKSVGLQARMFADGLRRVKGKMRRKRIVVVGVNQLRDKPMVMYGCFQHGSKVMLADGSTQPIGEIVDGKKQVEVMSFNTETQTFEPRKVVNWFNNGPSEQFIKVTVQLVGGYKERSFLVTPNHKMLRYGATEMEPMSNFEIGDSLSSIAHKDVESMATNLEPNLEQKQFLIASALTTGLHYQQHYAEAHVFQLDAEETDLVSTVARFMHEFLYQEDSGKVQDGVATYATFRMFHPLFTAIGNALKDTDNLKLDELVPKLTIQGLSMMFQLQGTYVDQPEGPYLVLPCKRFNEHNIQLLMAHLHKLTGYTWSNSEQHQGLVVDSKNVDAVMRMLGTYSIGGSNIPAKYAISSDGNKPIISEKPAGTRHANLHSVIVDLETITEKTDDMPVNFDKYDIEVEGNHNYIVDNCIVHNSPEQEPGGNALKFYCHDGNTMINTDQGFLYPDEILGMPDLPNMLGSKGLETPTIYKRMDVGKAMALTTDLGFVIGGKPDHRVMTVTKGSPVIGWSTLEELKDKKDVYVAVKHSSHTFNSFAPVMPTTVDTEKWDKPKLGLLLAYLSSGLELDTHIQVNIDKGTVAKFTDVLNQFNLEHTVHEEKFSTTVAIPVPQLEPLADLGLKIGSDAVVPWYVRCSTESVQKDFIEGIVETGAHKSKIAIAKTWLPENSNHTVLFSVTLAKEMQVLLANVGILVKRSEIQLGVFSLEWDSTTLDLLRLFLHGSEQLTLELSAAPEKEGRDPYSDVPFVFPTTLSNYSELQEQYAEEFVSLNGLSLDFFENLRGSATPETEQGVFDLMDFVATTGTNNITWEPIRTVEYSPETQFYDANMPETSTIVTSSIISHNSDVRFRASSVAIPHGKGYEELEESVVYDGEDKYRYIKLRTHKNKLGGIPNQTLFARLVIEDANGNAKGFCRTWDAFQYLKLTGQVAGTRKKIKFLTGVDWHDQDLKEHHTEFKNPLAGQTLAWIDFKCLIEGHKRDIAALCKNLGMSRPVILRNYLAKQCASGEGYELLKINKRVINAKTKAKAGSVDDDDD